MWLGVPDGTRGSAIPPVQSQPATHPPRVVVVRRTEPLVKEPFLGADRTPEDEQHRGAMKDRSVHQRVARARLHVGRPGLRRRASRTGRSWCILDRRTTRPRLRRRRTSSALPDAARHPPRVLPPSGSRCQYAERVATQWRWTQLQNMGPTARGGAAVAWHPGGDRVLLFGGLAVQAGAWKHLADTWLWDGSTWGQVEDIGSARESATMAASHDGGVLLFGGADETGAAKGTWFWDGTAWTQVEDSGPSNRLLPALAADPAQNVTVLAGGLTSLDPAGTPAVQDTWHWDGTRWSQVSDTAPALTSVSMAFDATLNQMVLVGHLGSSSIPRTYIWTQEMWVQMADTGPDLPVQALFSSPTGLVAYTGAGTWTWDGSGGNGPVAKTSDLEPRTRPESGTRAVGTAFCSTGRPGLLGDSPRRPHRGGRAGELEDENSAELRDGWGGVSLSTVGRLGVPEIARVPSRRSCVDPNQQYAEWLLAPVAGTRTVPLDWWMSQSEPGGGGPRRRGLAHGPAPVTTRRRCRHLEQARAGERPEAGHAQGALTSPPDRCVVKPDIDPARYVTRRSRGLRHRSRHPRESPCRSMVRL